MLLAGRALMHEPEASGCHCPQLSPLDLAPIIPTANDTPWLRRADSCRNLALRSTPGRHNSAPPSKLRSARCTDSAFGRSRFPEPSIEGGSKLQKRSVDLRFTLFPVSTSADA